MNNSLIESINKIDESKYKLFKNNTNSFLNYDKINKVVSHDFSWIDVVEECIPYLDTIIRNPRKFIQQEEDIVIVEKAKKISSDTIIHLAQNTNYIQDIDEDGLIKPSKVLNVNKEETWDLYENRFIYTLIKELSRFIKKYSDIDLESPMLNIKKVVNYNAETLYKDEKVSINMDIESQTNDVNTKFDKETIKKRIINLKNIVNDFENSSFIKSLSLASPVKSPIRKTNIILKDVNFQKSLELWNYIKDCEILTPEERQTNEYNMYSDEIKEKFDFTYFVNYLNLKEDLNKTSGIDGLEEKLSEIIYNYLYETNLSEKKMNNILKLKVKSAIRKKNTLYKEIKNEYNSFIKQNNEYINMINNLI